MRDDFSKSVATALAHRVGYKCSNPSCRILTTGPDGQESSISIGVAAHITAASANGPRFDLQLTSGQRSSMENGIWLCQRCSRLIDVDVERHPIDLLREWKNDAEGRAYWEQRGYHVTPIRNFQRLELKMPELVAEMRADLTAAPFTREFIALSKRVTYNGQERPYFQYFFEDHDNLLGKLKVFENYGATIDRKFNMVDRWEFTEDFVEFLEG